EGITRTFHQGEKTAPVLEKSPELAHESDGVYLYGTVIYDEEESIYKMWYASYDGTTYDTGVVMACYATSKDGINWEKPNLGLVSYNGSKDNNIIGQYHLQSVIKDDDETDPAKRYKMITYDLDGVYSTHYSADGLSWTRSTDFLKGLDVVTASKDNTNDIFYSVAKINLMKRNQWTLTAKDIDNWSVPVMSNTLADLIDTRLCYKADSYGMGLYERDGVYIGLNWMFYIPGTNGAEGQIVPLLAFSRDLTDEWQRPTRMPMIPLGEAGSSDDGMIFTASTAIEVGDEVWVYCGAWDGDHGVVKRSCNIYIAKWRLDGFASLDSESEGVITTRPFTFDGESLYINANASEGTLYAELLDQNGNVIDGFGKENCAVITTDSVRHPVFWNGSADVSSLSGEEISLRIYSENTEIYSFAFGERAVAAPESIEEYALRASGETSGMRFLAEVAPASRNICDEYGFIVARADILEKIGASDDELTFDLTHEKFPEPLGTLYVKGEAYKAENGKVTLDKVYKHTDEGAVIFSAVCTEIDITDKMMVTTKLTVRPYIKIGEKYAYGKPMTKSLYEVAVLVKNSSGFETLSDTYKTYVENIIKTAES
ncbi:MAG: hypothetical protein IJZ20_02720, partial [Clostridia bacterium]|nr:hypothetical protein [Clostridia bacterium]